MSSVYSMKTGIASFLTYSPVERDRSRNACINRVRFEMPKQFGLLKTLEEVMQNSNYALYNDFVAYLREDCLPEQDFQTLMLEARKAVNLLNPKYVALVESLLSLQWINRSDESCQMFTEFMLELMVAHTKYVTSGIQQLIQNWIPSDKDVASWPNCVPTPELHAKLLHVHRLLDKLLNINPLIYDVVLDTVKKLFPYYKKAPHVVGGYLHNVLWLLEYQPKLNTYVIELVFHKLLLLDVNAPRNEIQDQEDDETDDEFGNDEEMFEFEMEGDTTGDESEPEEVIMKHPIAETLDICMDKMFCFLDRYRTNSEESFPRMVSMSEFYKTLMAAFENVILPSHNTHHVQFLVFYFCSFKQAVAEKFLSTLWTKAKDPNISAPIRQASVGYIASFLARSKYLPLVIVQNYLVELCNFAHQYIRRSDTVRTNCSLKANIVFFSVCQAVFYVIAFRSRDLTNDKKDLHLLQSLQLSALVTCSFNPLRVCLPPVAVAFAGVTRSYQLAYCHTILERNARRKLATVYANDVATPEEVLDTFFPFDPYLLKKSGERITQIYLQYQANDDDDSLQHKSHEENVKVKTGRKRGDSEMCSDDVDDFILTDKRQRLAEMSRSMERDPQYNYGISPGFHNM